MSSSLTGISTKYYFIVKQLKVLIRLDFYWLVLIGVGRKKNHTFVFLKKKSNNQNHQDIAVYSSTRDISNYFLSFSQLELVACFQLLSLALQTGQMTCIAPQNLDG